MERAPDIRIERGRHGLLYATSRDLPKLFVAEVDEASLRAALPEAIAIARTTPWPAAR